MDINAYVQFYEKIIEFPNSLFDEIIQSIFSLYLKSGDAVVEVGANVGTHTTVLAKIVGPTGKVHAFEPFDSTLTKLKNRISQNQLRDVVKIYALALSNYKGEAEFKVFKENPGICGFIERPWYDKSKMDVITVPVDFIDNLFTNSDNIRLLKIDAEGADFDIIRGAKNNINKSRPLIIFEGGRIKDNPAKLYNFSKEEFIGFFDSIGYEIYDTFGMRFNYDLWNEKTLNDFIAIPKENLIELENLVRIAIYSVLLKYFTISPTQ